MCIFGKRFPIVIRKWYDRQFNFFVLLKRKGKYMAALNVAKKALDIPSDDEKAKCHLNYVIGMEDFSFASLS
jgi:hypothetical protein